MIIFLRIVLVYLIIGFSFGLVISIGMDYLYKETFDKYNLLAWVIIIFNVLSWPGLIIYIIKNKTKPRSHMDETLQKLIEDWESEMEEL